VVIINVKVNSNDAPNAIKVAKKMALLFVGAALAISPGSRDFGTGTIITFSFSWHKYGFETITKPPHMSNSSIFKFSGVCNVHQAM